MAAIACSEEGEVVASVYLYETDLFLFAEFLVTNPDYPRRLRHLACMIVTQSTLSQATARGIYVVSAPRTTGLERILARAGFRDSTVSMWIRKLGPVQVYRPPSEQVTPPASPKRAVQRQAGGVPPPRRVATARRSSDQPTAEAARPTLRRPETGVKRRPKPRIQVEEALAREELPAREAAPTYARRVMRGGRKKRDGLG